jgi:hypothetical protein
VIDVLLRGLAVGVGIQIGRQLVTGNRSTSATVSTPAGWYPDPWREHDLRWWDRAWTGYTHD